MRKGKLGVYADLGGWGIDVKRVQNPKMKGLNLGLR